MKELNEKLNTWARTKAIDYTDTEIGIAHCFKHLMPKLQYWKIVTFGKRYEAMIARDSMGSYYSDIAETPTLAICRAIEKLIDVEAK